MTRTWVDDAKKTPRDRPRDQRWVMRCDVLKTIRTGRRCTTKSEPFNDSPPLTVFAARGWFIARLFGDVCPVCLAEGFVPTAEPSPLMAQAAVPT